MYLIKKKNKKKPQTKELKTVLFPLEKYVLKIKHFYIVIQEKTINCQIRK